jgi:hypothetical protein
MRKIILFVFILYSSSNVVLKKHNAHLTALIPIDQLKSDVDFTNEITKFTSQSLLVHQQVSFDFKFDSIKSTIDQPITPLAFYKN